MTRLDATLAAVRDVRLFIHKASRVSDPRSRTELLVDAQVALRDALDGHAYVITYRPGAFNPHAREGEPLSYAHCSVCGWSGPKHDLRHMAEIEAKDHECPVPERDHPALDALAQDQIAQSKRLGYRNAETRYFPERGTD